MNLLLVVIVIMTWQFEQSKSENAKDVMEMVGSGVEAGKAILEVMGDEKFSKNFKKIQSIGNKLVPFLGALGPAVSLITLFLPDQPSPEMEFMKEKFAKIDAEFDKVFEQFDEVKSLIKKTSLKNQYGKYEHTIMSLSEKLKNFFEKPVSSARTYKRRFITEYESSFDGAANKLWRGMMEEGVLSDNIPATAISYTSYHRRRVQNIMKGVLNLILQGVKIDLCYLKFKDFDDDYILKTGDWVQKIKQLLDHMKDVDSKVKMMWHSQAKKEIDSKLAEYQGKSNSDFAKGLYVFLAEKYDWRDFHVVAYDALHGGDKHWVKACSGYHRFRTHGRNMVMASVDQSKREIDKEDAKKKLEATQIRHCTSGWWGTCNYAEAKDVYNKYLDSEFRKGCLYASVGVIKNYADIQHQAPSNRLVTVNKDTYKLHAFG